MEFLVISDTKLKVTLSAEERREYRIDAAVPSGAEVRRAVRDIILLAQRECGFSTEGRLLVQICPLPDSRCELLVSRLSSVSRRDRADLIATQGLSLLERRRSVYRFADSESLVRAVGTVRRTGIESDLYRDDLGRYYILLNEELTDGVSELEIFIEFGDRLPSMPIAVLSEYGTLLAKENALDSVRDGTVPLDGAAGHGGV